MNWDAPIAISVFRKRKGKLKQALCMSLYMKGDVLFIGQMQGIRKTDVPAELREWPKRFLNACQLFCQKTGLREIRLPQARYIYAYRYPFLMPFLSLNGQAKALRGIRGSMELLYDTNAIAMGYIPDKNWLVWKNPDFIR